MKQILSVEINGDKAKKYDIVILNNNIAEMLSEIKTATNNQKKLYVVSKKVFLLYKEELNLDKSNVFILNDGEKEKNFKNYTKILKKAAELNLTRKDAIVAIGGGVVGDIAGFAASTYMRGIDYIQVPTTLLSMVDSSVGGKTAIDLDGVKNIVGAFWQPKAVYININFLNTLADREFLSGLGEVLKYAFIEENCGYKHPVFMFEYLTLSCGKVFEKEPMTIMRLIEYCLYLKTAVVNQDEKENGLRKVLNLGHTLGHALETITDYRGLKHGEAVVQGMFFVFNYAYEKGLINYSYYRLSMDLLNKYGFKNLFAYKKYSSDALIEIMKKDKKASNNKISFIVPCEKKRVQSLDFSLEDVLKMF